jgi:hypothetical protein
MSEDSGKASFFELESIFKPIANKVSEFADENGLRLKKSPRGNSGWELFGDHPGGGEIFLLLLYDQAYGLGIGSVWQYPCEEMSRLYSHFRAIQGCSIEPSEATTKLSEEFQAIRTIKFGYWTQISPLQQSNDN